KGGKRFFITMLWEVLRANKIIYLPGENNLRSFYPTLSRIVKVLRKELLYIVVGGWLYEFLKMNERCVPLLKREKGVLVETKYLVDSLTLDLAFTNVEQFPNFRMQTFIPEVNYNDDKFRLVFMARIMRKKGIEYIFRFANVIKD